MILRQVSILVAVVAIARCSFCGLSTIPYSLEITTLGEPILGCARPSCFGWDGLGHPATEGDAIFDRHPSGILDGFVRESTATDAEFRSLSSPSDQMAICGNGNRSVPCGSPNVWVAGISAQPLLANGTALPFGLRCCYSHLLDRAEDRGTATVRPGQLFRGGEVNLSNSTIQLGFDYIADVQSGHDPSGFFYIVTVKRIRCSSRLDEAWFTGERRPDPPDIVRRQSPLGGGNSLGASFPSPPSVPSPSSLNLSPPSPPPPPPSPEYRGRFEGCGNEVIRQVMDMVMLELALTLEPKKKLGSTKLQEEVQNKLMKSYETFIFQGEFGVSSHQLKLNGHCRLRYGKYTALVYETPNQYESAASARIAGINYADYEAQFAVMDLAPEPLAGSGLVAPPPQFCQTPHVLTGCANANLKATMDSVLGPLLQQPGLRLGEATKAAQAAIQATMGVSYEVVISKGIILTSSYQPDSSTACRSTVGPYFTMAYQSPVPYPINPAGEQAFSVMDFGGGERLSGSGLEDPLPFARDPNSPPNPMLQNVIQSYLGPLLKTGTRRVGDMTKRLQRSIQQATGMTHEVIFSKGDLVAMSQSPPPPSQIKVRIGQWTVLSYQSPIQYPLSASSEYEELFSVMDLEPDREALSGSNPGDLPMEPPEPLSLPPTANGQPRMVDTMNKFGGPRQAVVPKFSGCTSPALMAVMQSEMAPLAMASNMKLGDIAKSMQAAIQAQTGKAHEVILSKSEFEVVSQMSTEDGFCKVRVGEYTSMVYQTPGQFNILAEGRFAVMDLGEPLASTTLLCFPPHATVVVQEGPRFVRKRMDELRRNDHVQTVDSYGMVLFQPIVYWQHRDADVEAVFIALHTANGKVVEMTADHLIFKFNPKYPSQTPFEVAASTIVRGDHVLTVVGDKTETSRIVRTSRRRGRGIYSPVTKGRKIVVDGVFASCLSLTKSTPIQLLFKSYVDHVNRLWRMFTAAFRMDSFDSDFTFELMELFMPSSMIN